MVSTFFSRFCLFGLVVSNIFLQTVAAEKECDGEYNYILNSLGQNNNPFGKCSGNGKCIASLCQCDEGWTGLSDWINKEGEDCQINDIAVRCLWGLNILLAFHFARRSIPRIKTRWISFQQTKDAQLSRGKKYGLRQNRALLSTLIYIGILFPSIVIFAILRIVDTSQRVGVTWPITIIFFIVKSSFYLCAWLFQPALLETTLKGSGKSGPRGITLKNLLKVNQRLSLGQGIWSASGGILPFFTIVVDDPTAAEIIYYVYLWGVATGLVWLTIQAHWVKGKSIEVLDQSYSITKSEKTKKIKKRILDMQNSTIMNATFQCIVYFMWACVPFFWDKHDYLLPITWVAMLLLGKKMAFTAVRDTTATTSKQGSRLDSGHSQSDSSKQQPSRMYSSFNQVSKSPETSDPKFVQIAPSASPLEPPTDDDDAYV